MTTASAFVTRRPWLGQATTALLLCSASLAFAAAPASWTDRGCDGCHSPAGKSTVNLQFKPGQMAVVPSTDAAFKTVLFNLGAPMSALADDNTGPDSDQADRIAIRQYLLDARDGKVKAVAGGVESEALSFGSQVIGVSSSNGIVSITNERSNDITYSTSFTGDAGYAVTSRSPASCTATTVPAGTVCNLTITFEPTSGADGPRNGKLRVTLGSTNGDVAFNNLPREIALNGTATTAPQGRLETGALAAFPDTELASSNQRSVTLRNNGTASLSFTSFTLTGANPGDFTRSGDCSTASALDINATCTLTVTFAPAALGPRSATLTVAHNGSNPSAAFSLSGNGVPIAAPAVALDPAAGLAFGNQTLGGLYAARTLRLTNSGNAMLNIVGVAVEGAAFSNVGAAPCPATLVPSQFCDIDVRFSPPAATAGYSGAVRVTSNAAGSPHVAALSGNGVAAAVPVLTWDGAVTPLDFGNVSVGTVSALQSVTLRNSGPGGVTLSVINSVGADAAMFAIVSDPADATTCRAGGVLFEGQPCRIDIRFAPGANGARSATLQAASDGSPPPLRNLLGNGLSGPSPAIEISPATVTLDDTRVGAVSNPAEVVIRSSGAGPLTVIAMTLSGPFTMTSKDCPATMPFTLAAGATCAMTVRFAPLSEGAASGTLSVSGDASAAAQSVALSASGEAKADLGSGGCSLTSGDSLADPTLWALLMFSLAALRYRRRQRVRDRQQGRP
jgi:trimeric autotransporter adhesin